MVHYRIGVLHRRCRFFVLLPWRHVNAPHGTDPRLCGADVECGEALQRLPINNCGY